MRQLSILVALLLCLSCGAFKNGPDEPPDSGSGGSRSDKPADAGSSSTQLSPRVVAGGLAITAIDGRKRYEAYAHQEGGLMTPGTTLKFLIDNRKRSAPAIYFMNSNFRDPDGTKPDAARYHFYFGQRVLADFDETIHTFGGRCYEANEKHYIAGTIQKYFPGNKTEPLFGIQFWPEDIIHERGIVDAVRIISAAIDLEGAKLAFVATGVQQTAKTVDADLRKLGVGNLTVDDVLGKIDFLPLNKGQAWGYLRIFPTDPDQLSAIDIPVFNELPLDLTVVAGTITRAYQDPTSHVNLKSRERKTPNMVLRSAGPKHPLLAMYADQPVHLTVDRDSFSIEASTDDEVRTRLRKKLDKPWFTLPYQPTDELLSYADMCPASPKRCLALSRRYGGKATSLGFLTNAEVLGRASNADSLSAKLGYDIVPHGLGIPFKLYDDFVNHEPNSALRSKLEELIDREKRGVLAPLERRKLVGELQLAFYAAKLPPGMAARVRKRITEVLPGVHKIKVRSSANAEDMPGFDGAGLYTSFAANLKKKDKADGACRVKVDGVKLKMKPKTLACAMMGVFASTWNKRAIEERSYARLDHATAKMGIAIVPKYDLEAPIAANSVVVTRVLGSDNVFGYTFATQQGNTLVTNPDPGTLAENTIAAFIVGRRKHASFAVTRFATPKSGSPALDRTVLPDARLREMLAITRTAELAYCMAQPRYYPHDCYYVPSDPNKKTALDFELKFLEPTKERPNGRFICKQMRELSLQ